MLSSHKTAAASTARLMEAIWLLMIDRQRKGGEQNANFTAGCSKSRVEDQLPELFQKPFRRKSRASFATGADRGLSWYEQDVPKDPPPTEKESAIILCTGGELRSRIAAGSRQGCQIGLLASHRRGSTVCVTVTCAQDTLLHRVESNLVARTQVTELVDGRTKSGR